MPKHAETQLAQDFGERFEKTNTGEFLGAFLIICISLLIAYAMHLWHKTKSPTAQAEASLKVDWSSELTSAKSNWSSELTNVKGDFSDKHANLDKAISLIEQEQKHQREKIISFETNINQLGTGLHDRLGKMEETILLLVSSRNPITKEDISNM